MNWSGKKVLVTGAGGFIGSHLAERLVARGARVRAFIRYNSTNSLGWLKTSPMKEDIEFVFGDVCDRDTVEKATHGMGIVFHLAALIGIPYSYQAPLSYIRTNVEGTLNVLQAAMQANVGLVVHTSTSEVYGTALHCPIDETHPLQGQSPYSASKIGADKIVEAFYRSYSLPVIIARPFNTYGPRQSDRAVIPTIITQALTQPKIRLGSVEPTRDFTYVDDTAEGFIQLASQSKAIGQVVNIGSGQDVSIKDLASIVLSLIGTKRKIVPEATRVRPEKSEVGRLCADNRKAQRLLGWKPKCSLRKGLAKTIEWIDKNLSRYEVGNYKT